MIKNRKMRDKKNIKKRKKLKIVEYNIVISLFHKK